MCLYSITKQLTVKSDIDESLKQERYGWKVFVIVPFNLSSAACGLYGEYFGPDASGKPYTAGEWLTAHERFVMVDNIGSLTTYWTGFHFFESERDAERWKGADKWQSGNRVVVRVKVRGVHTQGTQIVRQRTWPHFYPVDEHIPVFVAKEMMIEAMPEGL